MQPEPVRDLAATLGGTYRLIHEISRGGMGVVFRAHDLALERPVAVKMLRPDVAGRNDIVERFRSEAAMLARVRHPNLVQVYSFGATGGDSYFVMELVEGESREQAIERCKLEGTAMPLPEIASVVEQIASALDALHDRGIVHRDVKPANVILDPFRDRAVLVDVGIARRYGERSVSAGTPGYVAPEVISGTDATARSDVYGLAATSYAMLTLRPPWGEDNGDLRTLLQRQALGALKLPSATRPELAPVDAVLSTALSVATGARPASAGAFARELSRALGEVSDLGSRPLGRSAAGTNRLPRLPRPAGGAVGARTRGVAFRSIARAVGVREAERLRDAIGGDHPALARAMSHETAPLAWIPTVLLIELLRVAPDHVGRERLRLARDAARAAVRASFRRFFPASPATLVPTGTLSAIHSIWDRYHTWGAISSMPVGPTEVVIRLADPLGEEELCGWTGGMLEQLVLLSGGKKAEVEHHACESRGDRECLFRVTWSGEA